MWGKLLGQGERSVGRTGNMHPGSRICIVTAGCHFGKQTLKQRCVFSLSLVVTSCNMLLFWPVCLLYVLLSRMPDGRCIINTCV